MKLHLDDLRRAMKSQFVWYKRTRRRGESDDEFEKRISLMHELRTDKENEVLESLALIVFCGAAEMYGFDNRDVFDYLGVDKREFSVYKNLYERYMRQAVDIRMAGGKLEPKSAAGRVFTKMGLVRNYINLNFPEGSVRLRDLPNA